MTHYIRNKSETIIDIEVYESEETCTADCSVFITEYTAFLLSLDSEDSMLDWASDVAALSELIESWQNHSLQKLNKLIGTWCGGLVEKWGLEYSVD